MTDARHPPTAGIGAGALVVALVFGPFLLLSGDEVAGLQTYYGYGLGGPWAIALLALLSIVVFAAGRQGRTDPVLASAASLVFGLFVFGLALQWALAVPADVVAQIGTATWLEYHRWVLVGTAALLPASAAAYARAIGVF